VEKQAKPSMLSALSRTLTVQKEGLRSRQGEITLDFRLFCGYATNGIVYVYRGCSGGDGVLLSRSRKVGRQCS